MKPERDVWIIEAEKMVIDEGITWEETAEKLNRKYGEGEFTRPIVRNGVRRYGERWAKGERSTHGDAKRSEENEHDDAVKDSGHPYKTFKKKNADGSFESVEFIELWEGEELTDEDILRFHKLNPEKWKVYTYTNNLWHAMTGKKDGNRRKLMYQSKLVARPRFNEITVEDIDAYMASKVFANERKTIIPIQYDPNGEVLEICLPDFHGGLLSWIQETGADYDIHIAKDLFFQCLNDVVARCQGRKFKKILFATLGDLMHIDNDNQTTTKGTFQQADGRTPKIADTIMYMLIYGIEMLEAKAQVHVNYLCWKHDRTMGRMLMMTVCQAFRNDENVTFDMAPNPMKHIEIGCNLIGFAHGDMLEKNKDKWLQIHAREAWGRCKHAEVHQGHLHNQSVKEGKYITFNQTVDQGGVVIRTLPVICNASYWENQQGYAGATKALMCFVWNEKSGLREMWYSCV